MPASPAFPSRLPDVGTTIFSRMSALAEDHAAVNLGQGFPDFDCDPGLVEAVAEAMRAGRNQYPPMAGVPALREQLSAQIESLHGRLYDPHTELTITAGATQALLTALLCCVQPGDEVIVLEPAYDSYTPAIRLAGGVPVRVALAGEGFDPDFAALSAAIGPRTRALIINTPHNPTGSVWTLDQMRSLADLLRGTDVLLLCDEVYEHMVFDGRRHVSAAALPGLAERAFVVSSFGKTYHVTGWKVGHVAAPAALMAEFRKVHQFNVFTVNAPMQHGLARFLAEFARPQELAGFYQAKRDRFRRGLAHTRLRPLACEGTYFQTVAYDAVSDLAETAFCEWLTREVGVAAIPMQAFYADGRDQRLVRLCFAKTEATLDEALRRLSRL